MLNHLFLMIKLSTNWKFLTILVITCLFWCCFTTCDTQQSSQSSENIGLANPCPAGEFLCDVAGDVTNNDDVIVTSPCLPQELWCDNIPHCPNGTDELHEVCQDLSGWWGVYIERMISTHDNSSEELCDLNLTGVMASQCNCTRLTSVKCHDLDRIPQFASSANVTRLILYNNNISHVASGSFQHYTNLRTLSLDGAGLTALEDNVFVGLSRLKILLLGNNALTTFQAGLLLPLRDLNRLYAHNNQLTNISPQAFRGLESLYWADLRSNKLSFATNTYLPLPLSTEWLLLRAYIKIMPMSHSDLDDNEITSISRTLFSRHSRLTILLLGRNRISYIEPSALANLTHLVQLDLSNNYLTSLHAAMFFHNRRMDSLNLATNPIGEIPTNIFSQLTQLTSLNLTDITITNISPDMFNCLTDLDFVYFASFQYCQYARHVRSCQPKSDGISSLHDLLGLPVHRVCVWIVAIATVSGNALVFAGRCFVRDENEVPSFFIKNLCAADFLMGIYLLIIGAHDVMFRGIYNKVAYDWMRGVTCQAAGALALVSTEVSIIVLALMSVERYLTVSYPFKHCSANPRTARFGLAIAWISGLQLAVVPLLLEDFSGHFYGSNGVCMPLQIHKQYDKGWQYSTSIFVGVNSLAVVVIAMSYGAMFVNITRTRKRTPDSAVDVTLAKRFFIIVFTNLLCWLPIITVKLVSFLPVHISDDCYAWLTIFVLPINSATNPVLYSLSIFAFRKKVIKAVATSSHSIDVTHVLNRIKRSRLSRPSSTSSTGSRSKSSVLATSHSANSCRELAPSLAYHTPNTDDDATTSGARTATEMRQLFAPSFLSPRHLPERHHLHQCHSRHADQDNEDGCGESRVTWQL